MFSRITFQPSNPWPTSTEPPKLWTRAITSPERSRDLRAFKPRPQDSQGLIIKKTWRRLATKKPYTRFLVQNHWNEGFGAKDPTLAMLWITCIQKTYCKLDGNALTLQSQLNQNDVERVKFRHHRRLQKSIQNWWLMKRHSQLQLHPACHMLGNEMAKVDSFLNPLALAVGFTVSAFVRVAVVKHLQIFLVMHRSPI